ncbi:MAG TPA: Na+/H+ antiporter subunit E [Terriglobia bacterium]|nr:Na+/H+ antiporter subunit E [Terriglobia bacterium]
MTASDQQERIKEVVFWIGNLVTLIAFWIALTGSFRWPELLIGAGAAVIASIASVATEATTLPHFLPHWRYVWRSRGVIWQIPLGVIFVLRALWREGRHASGQVGFVPFDPGGEDAESETRRAVAEAFPTITPGSIVIGVDRDARVVIFHLLGSSSPPPTLEQLGEAK